ncbi:hypothetical protein, partial [Pseudomonas syringae]|uniref:hypothetical protein n=1 Tax=Pseudomonas syringae TaxID=317 RepID=UPI001F4851BE
LKDLTKGVMKQSRDSAALRRGFAGLEEVFVSSPPTVTSPSSIQLLALSIPAISKKDSKLGCVDSHPQIRFLAPDVPANQIASIQ